MCPETSSWTKTMGKIKISSSQDLYQRLPCWQLRQLHYIFEISDLFTEMWTIRIISSSLLSKKIEAGDNIGKTPSLPRCKNSVMFSLMYCDVLCIVLCGVQCMDCGGTCSVMYCDIQGNVLCGVLVTYRVIYCVMYCDVKGDILSDVLWPTGWCTGLMWVWRLK